MSSDKSEKIKELEEKIANAPTPALKAKFEKKLEKLKSGIEEGSTNETEHKTPPPPLPAETKMKDPSKEKDTAEANTKTDQPSQASENKTAPPPLPTEKKTAPPPLPKESKKKTSSSPTPVNSDLSATMMADLPGADPFSTMMNGDGANASDRLGLTTGTMLADRYEIREQLGAGGMGAVYSAYDKNRDEEIAIKVLLPGLTRNEQARERFLSEARLSSSLSHPNIVNVFDVQNDGDFYYITMEKLEGQTLRQRMNAEKSLGRDLTMSEIQRVIPPLCEALVYAHEKTVHRDIKPENIFLCDDGAVKLLDFGIARLLKTSQLTMTGMSMGTAYYMAPEQLQGQSVDKRADVYSLAVIIYELLSGQIPAGRVRSLRELNSSVPKAFSNAIDDALEADPENRTKSVSALAARLKFGFKKGKTGPSGKTKPKKARSIISLIAAAVFAILALAGGGVAFATRDMWLPSARLLVRNPETYKALSESEKSAGELIEQYYAMVDEFPVKDPQSFEDAQVKFEAGQAFLEVVKDDDAKEAFDESLALIKESVQYVEAQKKADKSIVAVKEEIELIQGQLSEVKKTVPFKDTDSFEKALSLYNNGLKQRSARDYEFGLESLESSRRLYQDNIRYARKQERDYEELTELWRESKTFKTSWESIRDKKLIDIPAGSDEAMAAFANAEKLMNDKEFGKAILAFNDAREKLKNVFSVAKVQLKGLCDKVRGENKSLYTFIEELQRELKSEESRLSSDLRRSNTATTYRALSITKMRSAQCQNRFMSGQLRQKRDGLLSQAESFYRDGSYYEAYVAFNQLNEECRIQNRNFKDMLIYCEKAYDAIAVFNNMESYLKKNSLQNNDRYYTLKRALQEKDTLVVKGDYAGATKILNAVRIESADLYGEANQLIAKRGDRDSARRWYLGVASKWRSHQRVPLQTESTTSYKKAASAGTFDTAAGYFSNEAATYRKLKTDAEATKCTSCSMKGTVERKERCSSCSGRGSFSKTRNCSSCGGKGKFKRRCSSCGGSGQKSKTCFLCSGSGRGIGMFSCTNCFGRGRTSSTCGSCFFGTTSSSCRKCSGSGTTRYDKDCSDCYSGRVTRTYDCRYCTNGKKPVK